MKTAFIGFKLHTLVMAEGRRLYFCFVSLFLPRNAGSITALPVLVVSPFIIKLFFRCGLEGRMATCSSDLLFRSNHVDLTCEGCPREFYVYARASFLYHHLLLVVLDAGLIDHRWWWWWWWWWWWCGGDVGGKC